MTTDAENCGFKIELTRAAPEELPLLANLLELYAHDFSEFHAIDLDAGGKFGYPQLPLYWREPDRFPFLVRIDGKLAGLVLLRKEGRPSANESVWDVAEFFVLRAYRRRGIGTKIAHQLWSQFPGRWEIRVMESNRSALEFWERAIAQFAGPDVRSARVEKNGQGWRVFSFESRSKNPPR
jgi:predicted acetyltransferase